jgi:hypothetical protein
MIIDRRLLLKRNAQEGSANKRIKLNRRTRAPTDYHPIEKEQQHGTQN